MCPRVDVRWKKGRWQQRTSLGSERWHWGRVKQKVPGGVAPHRWPLQTQYCDKSGWEGRCYPASSPPLHPDEHKRLRRVQDPLWNPEEWYPPL